MKKHIFQSSLVIPQWSIACSPQGRHPSGMRDNWLQSSFFMHSQPPAAEKSEMHLSQLTRAGPNLNDPEKHFMIELNSNCLHFSFNTLLRHLGAFFSYHVFGKPNHRNDKCFLYTADYRVHLEIYSIHRHKYRMFLVKEISINRYGLVYEDYSQPMDTILLGINLHGIIYHSHHMAHIRSHTRSSEVQTDNIFLLLHRNL